MGSFVLIGIVTRNRADILPKAIDSALAQRGVPIRVSVIDDASTDRTPDIRNKFPTVEWIHWPAPGGLVQARNYWMSSSDADYFVSLDDDAWFLKGDEVAVAAAAMESDPQLGAIGFDILSQDRPNAAARGPAEAARTFIGCGHIIRLSATRLAGLYEPAPGPYGVEEKDLCLRLLDSGYRVVTLPGVHVWHDKTTVSRYLASQHESGVCNDLVMTIRRTPFALLPLALASKFLRHIRFAIRNQLVRPCLAGFQLFVRSLPSVWKTRKAVKFSTFRTFMRTETP